MTIEQAIADRLAATGAVTAIVSTRIYQLQLRQSTALPAIRVQLVSDPVEYHDRGEINVSNTRIQVDCYGHQTASASLTDPYGSVMTLAQLVNDAITGEPFEVGDKRLLGVFRIDRGVSNEEDEKKLIRVRQDYRVRAKTI